METCYLKRIGEGEQPHNRLDNMQSFNIIKIKIRSYISHPE